MKDFQPWSLVLHIYQPPNQREDVLELVSREGYRGLLEVLINTPYPITLNVSGILLEQLLEKQPAILDLVRKITTRKNITLTNTAYTHALLPLWPDGEVSYQLAQNRVVVRNILGDKVKLSGLYLPECAYAQSLDPLIKADKSNYTIIDEISLRTQRYYPVVRTDKSKLRYLVRQRDLSQALATKVEDTATILNKTKTPLLAVLDGEVFGHFDSKALERLKTILNEFGDRLQTTGTLARQSAHRVSLRAASWETNPRDIFWQKPFPLWQDKNNRIQVAMWSFIKHVMRALHHTKSLLNNNWERHHFSNSMASCWWWWANPTRTAGPFKMKVWNPDLIVEGMSEAIKAIRTDPRISKRTKWRLETEYADLLKLIWHTHWKIDS